MVDQCNADTPAISSMEAGNNGVQKKCPFPVTYLQVPCWISGRYIVILNKTHVIKTTESPKKNGNSWLHIKIIQLQVVNYDVGKFKLNQSDAVKKYVHLSLCFKHDCKNASTSNSVLLFSIEDCLMAMDIVFPPESPEGQNGGNLSTSKNSRGCQTVFSWSILRFPSPTKVPFSSSYLQLCSLLNDIKLKLSQLKNIFVILP